MLQITEQVSIADDEIEMTAIRARGAGGQNVNKVSSAIHLRFDVANSSLPADWKTRLLALRDHRISDEGIVVIKAMNHRSQERNRAEALERLQALLRSVSAPPRKRVPTRPTRASKERRLESKSRRSRIKALRGKVDH